MTDTICPGCGMPLEPAARCPVCGRRAAPPRPFAHNEEHEQGRSKTTWNVIEVMGDIAVAIFECIAEALD